ncbi:MAG: lipoyl(octanoyl) transferase LipB [Planctomycetes bacterium]|nr:lipoyl(octanoyl) transferase LipB [Planctomycetota bacterium]
MTLASTLTSTTQSASGSLDVYLLGVVDFDSALFLQERTLYDLAGRDDSNGVLIICEHPPMITVGREGSRSHILADSHELTSRQLDVRRLNRGGGCFVHAPGQLAIYPILPLDRLQLGLAEYRQLLEESLIDVCRDLKVPAFRREDESGVFCRCGQIGHIGIAVKSWTSYHGMFLNVSPMPELMRLVKSNRCGEKVTTLSVQRQRVTPMHTVRESVIRNLSLRLGYEKSYLYTGHPLLRRTKRKAYAHA